MALCDGVRDSHSVFMNPHKATVLQCLVDFLYVTRATDIDLSGPLKKISCGCCCLTQATKVAEWIGLLLIVKHHVFTNAWNTACTAFLHLSTIMLHRGPYCNSAHIEKHPYAIVPLSTSTCL